MVRFTSHEIADDIQRVLEAIDSAIRSRFTCKNWSSAKMDVDWPDDVATLCSHTRRYILEGLFSLVGIAPSSRWTLLVMQRVGAVIEFGKNEAPGRRSSC